MNGALPHETAARRRVVAEARSWVGTPWVHAARVKGAGVDCGQLLAAVYEGAGVVATIETPAYPQDWALHRGEERFLAIVERYASRLPASAEPRPGDIALYRFGRCLSHAAIVLEGTRVVHAYMNAGRVVEDDQAVNLDLARRLAGYWTPWRSDGR